MCHAGTLVASQSVTQEVAGLSPFTVMTNIFTGRNEVVAKVIFLHLFVILFTGGCLPQCMLGYHPPEQIPPWEQTPPGADTPWEQTPPRSRHTPWADTPQEQTHPPRAHTPQSRHHTPSWEQTPHPLLGADTPREQTPSWSRHPSPREEDSGIRSMSGRYASYWNAFLLSLNSVRTNLIVPLNSLSWQ